MSGRTASRSQKKLSAPTRTKSGLPEFSVTMTEAKADPDQLLRRVRPGRAVCITRHGKPYLYIISASDYRRLVRNYRRRVARARQRIAAAQATTA